MNQHRDIIINEHGKYIITTHINNDCNHIIMYLTVMDQISWFIRILLKLDPITKQFKDENYLKNKHRTNYLENKNKLILINELLVKRDVVTIENDIIYLTNSYLIKLL